MVIESPEEEENIKSDGVIQQELTINLNKWGIVEVHFNPELQEINIYHLKYIRQKFKELGNGEKMLQFSTIPHAVTMSQEAVEYNLNGEAREFTRASAVLVNSLSKKIIFNVYVSFHKHTVPLRGFTSKEDAFVWLLGFKD